MGPCDFCGKPGAFGAPHPGTKQTVWACSEHKHALPARTSRDYAETEAEDREAAMRHAATVLVRLSSKEQVQAIGRAAFEQAFSEGLDAYFANRAGQLRP